MTICQRQKQPYENYGERPNFTGERRKGVTAGALVLFPLKLPGAAGQANGHFLSGYNES